MNINDKTTIPLLATLAAAPFAIGAILWLSSIDAKATKGAESAEIIAEIRERVVRIETLLEERAK